MASRIKLKMTLKDLEEELLDEETLIEAYSRQYGQSPEEVILAKERMKSMFDYFKYIKRKLSNEDWNILIDWLIEGKSYIDIGKKYLKTPRDSKLSPQFLPQAYCSRAKRRILNIQCFLRETAQNPVVTLLKPQLEQNWEKDAEEPRIFAGWLCSRLAQANDGAYWKMPTKTCHSKKEYKSRIKCKIPEYLHKCFGDNIPVCSACGIRCTRKSEFKNKK